jgi:ribosomal-protein-alanine N-acetyltransferase
LAAIVSLVRGAPQQWAEELPDRRIMWMSTLTTANAFRGRSLGREMVRHALQFLSGRGEKGIYLDCKPGFLESFYEAEGFVPIRRKSHASQHYPGESFETVLMQWGVCPWSARLRMRPMTLDDVDNLLMIFADPAAMEFWPALKTREEIVRSVEWMQRSYRENGYGLWAAALKDTGEFVGRVGLIRQDDVAGRVEVEVAYALVPRHWHRGYATEAARACRDWAFTHLDCDCVISLVHTRNLPSCRVAERNGMRVVAEITRWNLPHRVYAITRAEWKQLR